MADHLASIYGTEKDKVNCSFYYKIGACRHGERCSRIHSKPNYSCTIIMTNMYQNPANAPPLPNGAPGCVLNDEELQQHYENFYEDIFWEMEEKYGPIEEMNVCDNLGEHLIGNVYVMFEREEDAEKAANDIDNRWYAGRPIWCELSPVTDFREACCRQYEKGECTRGGFCNFMHLKPISRKLRRRLYGDKDPLLNDPHRGGSPPRRRERSPIRRSSHHDDRFHDDRYSSRRDDRGRDRDRERSSRRDRDRDNDRHRR